MDSIYPLENTYLTLLPVELRQLLYLYFNTAYLTYRLTKNTHLLRINMKHIYWFRILLVFNENYVNDDMLKFIATLKDEMALIPMVKRSSSIILDLNITQGKTLIITSFNSIIVRGTEGLNNEISMTIDIPFCIEIVKALEEVYNTFKQKEIK